MEVERVVVVEEVAGVFTEAGHFGEPILVGEIILETAVEPVGDIFVIEGEAVFGHFDFDDFERCAVFEEAVDDVALGFGELGDFARRLAPGGS